MNFKLAEIEVKNPNYDETIIYYLDWVSSGEFALRYFNQYLSFEKNHLKELISAYNTCKIPSNREPFWKGIVTRKGMSFSEILLEAYACDNIWSLLKNVKIISSSCDTFTGNIPVYYEQLQINIEILIKISEIVDIFLSKKLDLINNPIKISLKYA